MGAAVNLISARKRNLFINGGMSVNQRGNRTSVPTLAYVLDRWKWEQSGSMIMDIAQDTDVPTFAQANRTFSNSMKFTLNTADASIGATDYAFFQQYIEGYNYAQIAGKPFTISFWVKVEAIGVGTGIYSVLVSNSGSDRHYCAEYTVNALNTWEYKTVTIPAILTTSGTWNLTNGTGLRVQFALATGTNFQVTPGSWQNGLGGKVGSTNQINGVNAGIIAHRFTGMMLNEGTAAQLFDNNSQTQQAELATCQRYFQIFNGVQDWTIDLAASSSNGDIIVRHWLPMRTTPSGTFSTNWATNSRYYGPAGLRQPNAISFLANNNESSKFNVGLSAGATQFTSGIIRTIGSSEFLALDAEI